MGPVEEMKLHCIWLRLKCLLMIPNNIKPWAVVGYPGETKLSFCWNMLFGSLGTFGFPSKIQGNPGTHPDMGSLVSGSHVYCKYY